MRNNTATQHKRTSGQRPEGISPAQPAVVAAVVAVLPAALLAVVALAGLLLPVVALAVLLLQLLARLLREAQLLRPALPVVVPEAAARLWAQGPVASEILRRR